jgi:hypothetical protein
MTELTIADLEGKIAKVDSDIKNFEGEPSHVRQAEVLASYREYLVDQLNELKSKNVNN